MLCPVNKTHLGHLKDLKIDTVSIKYLGIFIMFSSFKSSAYLYCMFYNDLTFHFCTESRGCAKLSDDNKNALFVYESNFMTIQFCVEICRGQGKLFAALRVRSTYYI